MLRGRARVGRALLLTRRVIAISPGAPAPKFVGTALLVAIVVGSGIAAQRFSPGNTGLQLIENSIATGAGLVALILAIGPISGAHFNPVVTLADRLLGGIRSADAAVYVGAQVVGACVGRDRREPHVRAAGRHPLDARPLERRALARGVRRHLRAADRHPRGRARGAGEHRGVRGRRLHRRGLLVHVVDELREPRRHDRPHAHRHLRRHRPRRARRRSSSSRWSEPAPQWRSPTSGTRRIDAADLVVPHEPALETEDPAA